MDDQNSVSRTPERLAASGSELGKFGVNADFDRAQEVDVLAAPRGPCPIAHRITPKLYHDPRGAFNDADTPSAAPATECQPKDEAITS